ncbi:MAG: hypothetical protein IJW24_00065 [Clostridia bacterium]|nr:hypothetical protein [Clostridia bacterium]
MNLGIIAFTAAIVSNVCFSMGFGILNVIPHKKHTVFMLVSNLMVLVESLICTSLYYVLYNYVFLPFDLTELATFALVAIVLLTEFLGMQILRRASKENFYHYEKNFLFVVHVVILAGLAITCNLTLDFWHMLFYAGMQFAGMFAVNVIFYALNSRINNRTLPDQTRALAPQLVILAVLALIGFLAQGLIA